MFSRFNFSVLIKFLLVCIAICVVKANAVVSNQSLYEDASKRVIELQSIILALEKDISNKSLQRKSLKYKQVLKNNYEQELELIKSRIGLYRKLEQESLIMYSNTN